MIYHMDDSKTKQIFSFRSVKNYSFVLANVD